MITQIILAVSAIIIALKNIYNFFINDTRRTLKKQKEKEKKEMAEVVRDATQDEFENIIRRDDIMIDILKLLLASQIERIYWSGVKTKTLYLYNQETLNRLYETYKELGGNGYIETLMNQMKEWEIIIDPKA